MLRPSAILHPGECEQIVKLCSEASYENYMRDSHVYSYLLPHPAHCPPWCCTVTAVFHSSWRSSAHQQLRSFLTEDSCQYFKMSSAGGQHHAVFYFLKSNETFWLLSVKKKLFQGVSLISSVSRTWLVGTVGLFVWSCWSGTWTGPLSGPLVFSANRTSTSAGSTFSSSTFPSGVWKTARERERPPIRFSNSLGGNGRTGRKSCFPFTRSPLISPHTQSVT